MNNTAHHAAYSASLAVDRYILAIRNEAKAQYAASYYGFKTGLLEHSPERGDLSVMAAQAVRMNVDQLLANP